METVKQAGGVIVQNQHKRSAKFGQLMIGLIGTATCMAHDERDMYTKDEMTMVITAARINGLMDAGLPDVNFRDEAVMSFFNKILESALAEAWTEVEIRMHAATDSEFGVLPISMRD